MHNNMLVNIIHQQQNCWTNCLINLVHSCLQSFGTWNGSNNMSVYFAYNAGIMLDAFGYLVSLSVYTIY